MGDVDGPRRVRRLMAYAITPAGKGSEVALTEQSQVKNPVTRLMMKLFGETKSMDEHLQDLAKHFGETATIR